MRSFFLFLACLLVILPVEARVSKSHGYAQFGQLKYPANFKHFDWTNPGAIKGGTVQLMASGTFDTLNPYTLKGTSPSATSNFLQYGVLELNLPKKPGIASKQISVS